MKKFEIEIDGRKYVFKDLTFGEVNDLLRRTIKVSTDPNTGQLITEIDWPTFTELLIQKSIVEPEELKDLNKIRELPYTTARKIIDFLTKELGLFR